MYGSAELGGRTPSSFPGTVSAARSRFQFKARATMIAFGESNHRVTDRVARIDLPSRSGHSATRQP